MKSSKPFLLVNGPAPRCHGDPEIFTFLAIATGGRIRLRQGSSRNVGRTTGRHAREESARKVAWIVRSRSSRTFAPNHFLASSGARMEAIKGAIGGPSAGQAPSHEVKQRRRLTCPWSVGSFSSYPVEFSGGCSVFVKTHLGPQVTKGPADGKPNPSGTTSHLIAHLLRRYVARTARSIGRSSFFCPFAEKTPLSQERSSPKRRPTAS